MEPPRPEQTDVIINGEVRVMLITASRFSLTVDGYDLGSWSKVDGLDVSWDVAEYGDSDLPLVMKPRPAGMSRTLTLSRPRSTDVKLQTWYRSSQSTAGRKNAVLIVYDTQGAPLARYHLTNAWPSKLEIGSVTAGNSTQLMETVTIVSERIQRVSG
jgi:phage tail-like protein